jgi:hypothetical protein
MCDILHHPGLETALSLERFNRYLIWAGEDRARAIELYTLNSRISEALYIPLQMLEIALRNRIHVVMSETFHERWFEDEGRLLGSREPEQLKKALDDILNRKKEAIPGQVIAELTFGFWTAMLGTDYEVLWQTSLHKIAMRSNGKRLRRKDLSAPLASIRNIRNRIARHEPILYFNIPKHYENMLTLTEWLSPPAAIWCRQHCRFFNVYPTTRIELL